MSKYPDAAGKRYINARGGRILTILYRWSHYYYAYYYVMPPLVAGYPGTRVYGKIALHVLFNHYLEVITPCATVSGGTPVSV